MDKINLPYNELETEVLSILAQTRHMVLATAAQNRVTARTMSIVNIRLDLYFQTDRRFLKVDQIERNPNVALCAGSLQTEGHALDKRMYRRHPFL